MEDVRVSYDDYQLQQSEPRRPQIGDDVIVYWEMQPGAISKAPAKVVAVFTSVLINVVAFLDGVNQSHLGGTSDQLTKWVTSISHKSTRSAAQSGGMWWDWS